MSLHINRWSPACLFVSMAVASTAHAQLAVVDAPAVAQLVQEVQTVRQQLQVAQAQLLQAKQALQSMTGDRGMEWLLAGITRNYLPTTWTQLAAAAQAGGSYTALATDVRSAVGSNAVLSPAQLSNLSVADQQQIVAARQAAALRQALAQEALINSSGRFAEIQSLIAAISTAADQKAILDLQTRISAELGMLQNEKTKLQILAQASQAQDAVNVQREREQVIAGQGQFASRFRPTP
ncbi:MAG: type IV secretion system protein [Steroidobacteraceae bacterium]